MWDLTVSAKFVERGTLFFFLRLGGAIGASILGGLWSDDEGPILFCFVWDFFAFDAFVLAITSGSCRAMHVFSFLVSFCAVPEESIIELNCEYLFELEADAESKEFKDNAVTEAAFPRECSGNDPEVKKIIYYDFWN